MKKFFPILQWLPGYRLSWLKQDSVAGFTVAVMLIPQGMAYAMLAGMPAIAGLYGAMLALLAYTIFGTSRHVSIGPVAIDSILLVSGLSLMTHPGTESFILLAGLTALMVGTLQIIYGIGRMGFIVNFISHPVLSGFISAAAIIISLSQVKHILGITLPRGLSVPDTFDALIHALPQTHPVTLYMGLGSIIFLKVVKKIHASMPDALLLVILSILVTAWFHLDEQGLAVVGTIPSGLPVPRWPDAIDLHTLRELLPLAVTMSMISFMEVVALGKKFASKYQYRIDPNQELIAIGSANVFSGLFRAYPMGASFSRSAVNAQSGAQTQLSDFFTAVFLGLTLLFFTPLFYYLPVAVLAAIILVAIVKLIDYKEPVRLFRIKKQDFWVLIFAFISTLIFGVQYGVLMGMGASVLIILQRLSRPHVARMGQIPGTDILRNFKRAPEARAIEGLFIFRIDASLAFTNVSFLRDLVEEEILNTQRPVRAIIFDASSVNDLDATADLELHELTRILKEKQIELFFTNVKGPVRDIMKRSGYYDYLGSDHFFLSKKAAVKHYMETLAGQTSNDTPSTQAAPVVSKKEND